MLFNSYEFIFVFLPLTLAVFFLAGRFFSARLAAGLLAFASLFFYGYWSPRHVVLLVASILVNFFLARIIARKVENSSHNAKAVLIFAIALNLVALAYFKYANFAVDSINTATGAHMQLAAIVLPIGISFFTFTQIAFLVDVYRRKASETRLVHYFLFVTYFPHLIAGPVLHHGEMMPQFAEAKNYRFNGDNFLLGCLVFAIGLFKKVILADGIEPFVAPVFDHVEIAPSFWSAWGAALSYTMQLYFDFSGYSDMAIGLAKMVNIDLPLNFNSPYKALNISDFWRRWHMTLSRFLRDYLYIPLGGNRFGGLRRYTNLMITMLLGGLWHGAGWTFVIWGGLHGCYLVIHHGWQTWREKMALPSAEVSFSSKCFAWLATFLVVVIAWVFFRAISANAALSLLAAMAGLTGGMAQNVTAMDYETIRQSAWILVLGLISVFAPNTQEWVARFGKPLLALGKTSAEFRKGFALGAVAVAIVILAIISDSRGISAFIYFNF